MLKITVVLCLALVREASSLCLTEDKVIANLRGFISQLTQLKEGIEQCNQTALQQSSLTPCPNKWMAFSGSCYLFVKSTASFYDAESVCRSAGGHLVHVEGRAENEFIKSHLRERLGSRYWMGLTDAVTEGVWQWYGTGKTTGFTDWNHVEPSNSNGIEHCALFYSGQNYEWNDNECSRLLSFICEKEM